MTLAVAAQVLALVWLVRIAWVDFRALTISNREVLGVSLLLLAGAALGPGWGPLAQALAAGFLLFALGFAFWLMRMMGGGDAKLLFAIGLFLGWNGLAWFALSLLPASILVALGLRLATRPALAETALGRRAAAIRARRGVPYAVPLVLASVCAHGLGLAFAA